MPGDYSGGAGEKAAGDQPTRRMENSTKLVWVSASRCLQHNHRHQRAMYLAFERDLEACVRHGARCVAIPMAIAGEQLCKWHNRILYPCCEGLLGTHMFHQQQCASRLQDAHHLLEAALRVGDRTKN